MNQVKKGFIIAGWWGTRLKPATDYTDKHLLLVGRKPVIMYPYQTLKDAGVEQIFLIVRREYVYDFAKIFGEKVTYIVQEKPEGIASAFRYIKPFINFNEDFAVILGDNIYEKKIDLSKSNGYAKLFVKHVKDPERFGIAKVNINNQIYQVVEKPQKNIGDLAVTGLYVYGSEVFDIVKILKPSKRGELEITDINEYYAKSVALEHSVVSGKWFDVGTFEALAEASNYYQ